MEKIHLKDESNDRGYFTIIPNYILNHSTAVAQALYLQLKRLAGDNGIAYPSSRYLRGRLGISQPTLRKEFGYLLEKRWIEYIGDKEVKTDGGVQKIKSYKIVDLWDLNNKHYQQQRGEKIEPPCQRGEKIDTQGVKARGEKIGNKEEPLEEEPSFKKNINTATPSVAGRNDQDIIDILNAFKCVNSAYGKYFGNKTQRLAAARLVEVHGKDKVLEVIQFLQATNQQKFAPHIYTAVELENNWDRLKDFCISGAKPKKTLIV